MVNITFMAYGVYRQLAPRQLAPNLIGQFQGRYFILTWVLKFKMELTNQIRCELSWCELSVFPFMDILGFNLEIMNFLAGKLAILWKSLETLIFIVLLVGSCLH